ncbi:phage tail tape measure protein [Peptoniphilus asaccharolyticus]
MAKSRIYDATLRLVDKFSEPLKKMEKHLDNFERHYKNTGAALFSTGKRLDAVGKNLTKYVTGPILGVGAASVAAFKEVDTAMDTIITKTGATGNAVQEFEKVFRNIGGDLPVDLQKVGDAVGEVNTQFGLVGNELEKHSKQFIKFAEINGQDVSQASIQAKQAMEAYHLSANDLDKILDSVTATAQATGQSTDKLFDTVVRGAPVIKDLNLNFSQATALLGNLEQSGIDSTKALSYLSKAQVAFAKDGKDLTSGLGDLQKKLDGAKTHAEKLTIASKYFGTKGATFMLDALERGAMNFNDFTNAAELATGAVDKTFEETLDPIDKFKQLMNRLKFVGNDLFKASEGVWVPILEKAIGKVKKLSDWFNSLSKEQKENIVKWAGMAAALGPTLIVFGKLYKIGGKLNYKIFDMAKAVKKAGGIFKWITSPANLMLLKFMLIAAIVFLIIKNWDKIKSKAEQVFPGIGEKIGALAEKGKVLFKILVEFAKSMLDNLMQIWSDIWPALAPFVDTAIQTIGGLINGLFKILSGILDFLIGVFTGDWSRAWEGIKQIFSGVWDSIKTIAKGAMNGVINIINTAIKGLKGIKLPDWVPGVGGKGINIPLIPQLAKGTNFWKGGLVQIHERGGEIVDLPRGSRVMPHDKSVSEAYNMGKAEKQTNLTISIPKLADQIIVREEADIDRITNSLANKLKIAKLNAIGGY